MERSSTKSARLVVIWACLAGGAATMFLWGAWGAEESPAPPKGNSWPDHLKIPADLEDSKADLLRDAIDQFRRAEEANSAGKEMEAAAAVLASVKPKAAVPLTNYYLGLAYAHLRELAKARKELEEAVQLLPEFHEAFAKLGEVCKRLGDGKSALALAADYPPALDGQILHLLEARRIPEARKLLEHAHELEATEFRAALLEELDDYEHGASWAATHVAETEHFTVRTGVSAEIAAKVGDAAERCLRLLRRIFPDAAVEGAKCDIYVYTSSKEYVIAGGAMRGGGHYSPVFDRVKIANTDLFERLVPSLKGAVAAFVFHRHFGEGHPPWLLLGVQRFMEPAFLELIDDKDLWVQPVRGAPASIVQAIRNANFIDFETLMKMNQRDLDTDPVLSSSESWSIVFFCQQGGHAKYKKALEGYYGALKKGKSVDAAHQASFGKLDAARFVNDWKKYLADELPKLTAAGK